MKKINSLVYNDINIATCIIYHLKKETSQQKYKISPLTIFLKPTKLQSH